MSAALGYPRQRHAPPGFACCVGALDLLLLPEGVAMTTACRTMLVADLHLEKAAAFAERGQFLPPHDTLATLLRLEAAICAHAPERLVLLGDTLHSRRSVLDENGPAGEVWRRITSRTEIMAVAGNHDPDPRLPGLSGQGEGAQPAMILAGTRLTHEPLGAHEQHGAHQPQVFGHFHPVARLRTRAGWQRRRCFVLSHDRLLLPAFGSLTGGLDVRDPAIAGWFPQGSKAVLLAGGGLHPVPVSGLA